MTLPLSPTSVVSQRSNVRCENSVPDQSTLVDTDSGRMHHLNTTATLIWELCRQQTTIQAITDQLMTEFEVDPEQALADVCQVILHLNELGVVELE